MRGPRLIHLWGLRLPLVRGKKGKALINLRKAENDDIDPLNQGWGTYLLPWAALNVHCRWRAAKPIAFIRSKTIARKDVRFKPEPSLERFQQGPLHLAGGSWHSENAIKSPLIYSVSYLNLRGLNPPMLSRDDGTGLNFAYAVIIESLAKSYNDRIK